MYANTLYLPPLCYIFDRNVPSKAVMVSRFDAAWSRNLIVRLNNDLDIVRL